jgi:HK97 family phage major capsid protein
MLAKLIGRHGLQDVFLPREKKFLGKELALPKWLFLVPLLFLAAFAAAYFSDIGAMLVAAGGSAMSGKLALGGLGCMALPTGGKLYHQQSDPGVALPEKEFQDKSLALMEQAKTGVEKLTQDFDRLDKETKKNFEDLTRLKNNQGSLEDTLKAIQKVNLSLANERRMAFGTPIQRICNDPEKRARFNAWVRMAVDNNGDMTKIAKELMKALGEDSSPGSTLINAELAQDIYDSLAMYGAWNTLGVRRLGTKIQKLPIKTVRPIAYVLMSEGDTLADDANKAGTSVDLEVEIIAVLLNVSMQLIQDSEFDITSDILNDFAEAFAYRLDFLAFAANGTSTGTAAKLHGGMTGLFNFGTAAAAASGNTTVETLDFEDVTKCRLTVDSGVNSRATKWWMHPFILTRMLSIKDSNGRPIFLTALEAPTPGAIGSILGSPVVLVEAAPSTNSASAKVAVYGDPQAYCVGIRQDFTFESSDHHKWNTLQRSFRGYGRAGTKGRKASALATLTLAAS